MLFSWMPVLLVLFYVILMPEWLGLGMLGFIFRDLNKIYILLKYLGIFIITPDNF
jgi:hypothetical protein